MSPTFGWEDINRIFKKYIFIYLQNTLKNLTVQMTEGLNQFLVILHCCPRQQEEITTHPSPLPVSQLHQMALARSGDQLIEGAITDVEVQL